MADLGFYRGLNTLNFPKLIDKVFEGLSDQGMAVLHSNYDKQKLKKFLVNCGNQHTNFANALLAQKSSSCEFSSALLNDGFVTIKGGADHIRKNLIPGKIFTYLMVKNLIKGEVFYNFEKPSLKELVVIEKLHDFMKRLDFFSSETFDRCNVQIATSAKNPSASWAPDVLELHTDLPYPNLKAFVALNNQNSNTGFFTFINVRRFSFEKLFFLSACAWLSGHLQQEKKFSNCISERYSQSEIRNVFKKDFFEEKIKQPFDEKQIIKFELNAGEMVLSNNFLPHARTLGMSGWKNKRLFLHPLPYARDRPEDTVG